MRTLAALLLLTAALWAQGPKTPGVQYGTISGTVTGMDGKTAAAVRVSALDVGGVVSGQADQALLSITQTDANGRFRLEEVPPGRYVIVAGMLDLPSYFPGVAVRSGATVVTVAPAANLTGIDFHLAIPSALRFSGRVIRQDNAGQAVGTVPANASRQAAQIRLQPQNPSPGVQMVTAVVADNGVFEFSNVRPGTYRVILQPAPPRMPQLNVTLADADITNYELAVPLMVAVNGSMVLEDRGPVPRVQLTFSNANDSAPASAVQAPLQLASNAQFTVTAQAGDRINTEVPAGANRVTMSGLPPGFTVKKFSAGGVDLRSAPLLVTASGGPPIEIVLAVGDPAPWVRVTGRLSGRGNPEQRIQISGQAVASALPIVFYQDGSFEIAKVLPGTYQVSAGINTQLNVPSGIPEFKDVVIELGPVGEASTERPPTGAPSSAVRVRGRLIGRAMARPGTRVQISNPENGELRSATIFMDGSFEFQAVQPGIYTAEVIPPIPGASPVSLRVAAANIDDFRIAVPETREITGRVAGEGGAGVPPRFVFAAGDGRIPVTVQANGSFRAVVPGAVPIAVAADSLPQGYAVSSIRYGDDNLEAGPIRFAPVLAEMRIILKSTRGSAIVRGRVLGVRTPPGETRVWLMDASGEMNSRQATLGPDGAFEFASVDAGDYVVGFAAPGFSATASSARVAVVAGKDVTGLELLAPREVSGRVRIEGGGAAPRFSFRLTGGEAGDTTVTINPATDGVFTVFLPVGERKLGPVLGLPAGLAIQSLHYGVADLQTGSLRVNPEDRSELTIQLGPVAK